MVSTVKIKRAQLLNSMGSVHLTSGTGSIGSGLGELAIFIGVMTFAGLMIGRSVSKSTSTRIMFTAGGFAASLLAAKTGIVKP